MFVKYEPGGVVAVLIPWNFPIVLASRKISTALAAGCSVICKPDVITPGSVMELMNIINDPESSYNGWMQEVFFYLFQETLHRSQIEFNQKAIIERELNTLSYI